MSEMNTNQNGTQKTTNRKNNNQRNRKNQRGKKQNVKQNTNQATKKQQPVKQPTKTVTYDAAKRSLTASELVDIVEDLRDTFFGVMVAVNNAEDVVGEQVAETPGYNEHIGILTGIGYGLSIINDVIPLDNFIPKEEVAMILEFVEDSDMCDIDDGLIYDECF